MKHLKNSQRKPRDSSEAWELNNYPISNSEKDGLSSESKV